MIVDDREVRMKALLQCQKVGTVGVYAWMSCVDQGYFREYHCKKLVGDMLLNQFKKDHIAYFYDIMASLDQMTIHGVIEIPKQYLKIPTFFFVGASMITKEEYEFYIKILLECSMNDGKLDSLKMRWFHNVCSEVYQEGCKVGLTMVEENKLIRLYQKQWNKM